MITPRNSFDDVRKLQELIQPHDTVCNTHRAVSLPAAQYAIDRVREHLCSRTRGRSAQSCRMFVLGANRDGVNAAMHHF
jgi:hypothetical protein